MDHIGFVHFDGDELSIHVSRYADGSAAVQLYGSDGFPYATVSACMPGTTFAAGELLVKTADENADLRAPLLAAGLFEDTGRRVPTGHVMAEVWRFANSA